MREPALAFDGLVARLSGRARGRLVLRRALAGVFFGLLPGLALALLAGAVRLPVPAWAAAAVLAGVGAATGVALGMAATVDTRRILLRADEVLASRELISTAQELVRCRSSGAFAATIVEDATRLLAAAEPRAVLGPPRLRLAPFAALAAILTTALLLFPVDLRSLFSGPNAEARDLSQIGEDLRHQGEKLAADARARDLGRTLELSQDLAQLGKDLAARRITPDDALDRIGDLESGLAQQYQLQVQQAQPASPSGQPGPGSSQPGEPGSDSTARRGDDGSGGSSSGTDDKSLQDMGNALDRLRQAERQLGNGNAGGSDQAQVPGRPSRQRDSQTGQPGQNVPGGGPGELGQSGRDNSPEGSGQGQGSGTESPQGEGGSGVGSTPAPEKRGPPTEITQGSGPSLHASGSPAGEDSTKLLARALPEWTGSRLPEETIINQYSRAAESALRRDEVPLKLRQAVKEYFTAIGITK